MKHFYTILLIFLFSTSVVLGSTPPSYTMQSTSSMISVMSVQNTDLIYERQPFDDSQLPSEAYLQKSSSRKVVMWDEEEDDPEDWVDPEVDAPVGDIWSLLLFVLLAAGGMALHQYRRKNQKDNL